MTVGARKTVDNSRLWWELGFPQIRGKGKHIGSKGRIQGVAEDSGNKLRRPVSGSRELSQGSERPLNMEGPLKPRPANSSDFQFGAVATETIENALLHLAQQNERAVKAAAGRMGSFRETRIVGVDTVGSGVKMEVSGPLFFTRIYLVSSLFYARPWGS